VPGARAIVGEDYTPLKARDAGLGYVHLRGGITEQAMTDVADSLKLDVVQEGKSVYPVGCSEIGHGFDSHRPQFPPWLLYVVFLNFLNSKT
jgi:hypothetical protein